MRHRGIIAVAVILAVLVPACSGHRDDGALGAEVPAPLAVSRGPVVYVSSAHGSDGGTGSEHDPWRTVQRAVDSAEPGQIIMLREGVYPEWVNWWLSGGTADAPITLQAHPGERAVITGSLQIRVDWVRVSGLVFRGGTSANRKDVLLYVSGGDHIEISHNELFGSVSSAIFLGDGGDTADDVRVVNNHIHDNGDSGNFDHGVYCGHARGVLVANNVIERNTAFGVQLYPDCDDALVSNNTIVGNGRAGVIVGGDSETASDRDRVVNNVIARNSEAVVGYWPGPTGRDNRVERNLIGDNRENTVHGELKDVGNMLRSPRFVDYRTGDYRLVSRSAGVDDAIGRFSPDTDFVGRARPDGRFADLGAFESS